MLVNAFNAAHVNEINVALTVVPRDQYLQQTGAAASVGNLPDLLAANVIDGPNYSSSGLWMDITDRVEGLDFADMLAPAHLRAATLDDKYFAVPHVMDVSAMYYNTVLFERAGLDPASPPATMEEFAEAAQTIADLGPEYGGLYLPGNCAGCLVFTLFPSIWGSGGTVMDEDGTEGTLDSEEAREVFGIYHEMFASGAMVDESRNETGATQNSVFESGNVGFALLGSKALGQLTPNENLQIGVAPIPSLTGDPSTFVGGDIVGITPDSDHPEEAWTFLEWTLQEAQQLDIYAANKFMPIRTDLAENEFAAEDERLLLLNSLIQHGQTPYSPRFFQTFNDPTGGPWLEVARDAIFGSGPDGLDDGNARITQSLQAD